MTATGSLNAERRRAELEALARGEEVDLVVIGGGITGVGVALDAASRGLSVALLERHDLATGTSRWSSKLVHGGVRYLAQGEVAVAWESARERRVLMEVTAPHLVQPSPFLIAFDEDVNARRGLFVETGMRAADALRRAAGSDRRALPPPRRISRNEARRLIPALRDEGLRGALLCWDGQLVDDARLVVTVARTAAARGARILTYCSVAGVERGGVDAVDERTGQAFHVHARYVINCTGVWAPSIPGLDGTITLQPSKGVHLLVRGAALGHPRAGITVPVPGEPGRWVFFYQLPDDLALVGITDDPYSGGTPDAPEVTDAEERFLLETVSRPLARRLTRDDVVGRFAGLRPLLASGGARTSDLSRRHALIDDERTGAVSVVGGKLTTYRRMARDAVDHLARREGLALRPSRTEGLPLLGAAPRGELRQLEVPARLVQRYGIEAVRVAAMARGDERLLRPLVDGVPLLGVELLYGIAHEGALTLDDLLDRRTRTGLVPRWRDAVEDAAAGIVAGTAVAA